MSAKGSTLGIGARVEKNGDIGTVKFVGHIPPTSGEWVGIEWDDPSRGKHDGSKDGVSYFTCKYATSGSFVRKNAINCGVAINEAIKEKYTMPEGSADVMDNIGLYLGEKNKGKIVEGVGLSKVQKQFEQVQNLKQMVLRGHCISQAGPAGALSSLIPNIVMLDLSKNLLSSWSTVCEIAKQLPNLKELSLSENILMLDDDALAFPSFAPLHTLVLNKCQLTWQQVLDCSVMWPHVSHLHLVGNLITNITSPSDDMFSSMELLNLSENPINSWEDIRKLKSLPRLTTLYVNKCGFSSIRVGEDEFRSLNEISLSNNSFESFRVFNELNKLTSLSTLFFKNSPVLKLEDYHTFAEIVVAKMKHLKTLNRTTITEVERSSSELDYLRKYGLDWKNSGGHQDPELNKPSEEFLSDHPRYMELVEEYGAPADQQLIKKSTAIKANLIEVIIEAPVKPEFEPIKRRLPLSMTVGNLKLFIQKLTKIEVRKQRLVYVSKDDDSYVVELHRDFETLHDVSIEPLDRIQVRASHCTGSGRTRRWKPRVAYF